MFFATYKQKKILQIVYSGKKFNDFFTEKATVLLQKNHILLRIKTLNSVISNNLSLKYQRFTPTGWKMEIYRGVKILVCGKNSVPL